MKITILTAGTGSYYCGACMRDNALVKALRARGHDAHLVPMYLPLQLDEQRVDQETPVFFGGLNVYLQEKFALFRKLPRWVDSLFNGSGLLRAVAKRSHMTSAKEQGEMTYTMLAFEESHLGKELDKLTDWLRRDGVPDFIVLSNALLAGLTRELKLRLGVPVICTFQGEDSFLDGLPEPWRSKCWSEMAVRLVDCDALVSPSRFYADLMEGRLGTPSEVIPNGIDLTTYRQADLKVTRIGYLARMTHVKGLGLLIDAFIHLADPTLELTIAGTMGGGDDDYVASLKKKLTDHGLQDQVTWHPDLELAEKAVFLANLSIFSVPAIYPEGFGLYLVEAMAAGLPVVMPRASAFPEIIEPAGCGLLVEPEDPVALAAGLRTLIDDPALGESMGKKGRLAVTERYHVDAMAENFEELFRKVVSQ